MELNLEYVRARRLLVPAAQTIVLALVGCGGTGSWLAPSVVRVAKLAREKLGKDVQVAFVDPDRVEAKNCYRQNFCEAEIGANKAETLAFRLGCAWGVEVAAFPRSFEKSGSHQAGNLVVLIGCVDNPAARRSIASTAARDYSGQARVWWLDCGNTQASGQVLLGCGIPMPKKPFDLEGFCTWLPLPSTQHPELLEAVIDAPADAQAEERELSCADLAMLDSQGLAINQRIAAEATDYLVRLLLTRDLMKMATYLDLAAGSARSVYITPETVGDQ